MLAILFATQNPWKGLQFQPVFAEYGFNMLTLQDCPTGLPEAVESGATAVENALRKARLYHSQTHPWVFADDAGLEIDALNGEPGLLARRWGGLFPDDISDQDWLDYLLQRMYHVPPEQRTARFRSDWALIAPDGSAHTHVTNWPFEIATHPIRPIHPGSPITAVRVGPQDDLERRRAEIGQEWERWGILKVLRTKFGVEHE
jgi:XTP/dITP diphosphohydrolase